MRSTTRVTVYSSHGTACGGLSLKGQWRGRRFPEPRVSSRLGERSSPRRWSKRCCRSPPGFRKVFRGSCAPRLPRLFLGARTKGTIHNHHLHRTTARSRGTIVGPCVRRTRGAERTSRAVRRLLGGTRLQARDRGGGGEHAGLPAARNEKGVHHRPRGGVSERVRSDGALPHRRSQ